MINAKVGDEVMLKSGGPRMKVQRVGLAPEIGLPLIDAGRKVKVTCQWLHEGRVIEDNFLPNVLVNAEEVAQSYTENMNLHRQVGDVLVVCKNGPQVTVYEAGLDEDNQRRIWFQWFDGTLLKNDSILVSMV